MPASKNIDLSDGKFTISTADLLKLIAVVAAIGMSYAMASSRLSMIERGISDGQEAIARVDRRIDTIESTMTNHINTNADVFHAYDLRLQSLEERVFGRANPPSSPSRADTRSTLRTGGTPSADTTTPLNE